MTAVRPEALAAHVAAAARRRGAARLLLLDLDGTLAPIAPRPEQVRIPAAVLDALDRLRGAGWRAALVSGRPAAQVVRLARGRRIDVFGSHGLETPGGGVRLSPGVRRRLESLASAIERRAEGWTGVFVERKPLGLAVHDRALAEARLRDWRCELSRLLETEDLAGFESLGGRRVVEIRLAGAHKGRVVDVWPPAREAHPEDPSVVAAGDDRTDEDLFASLGPGATTIRVGPPGRSSSARFRLASPAGVGRFLEVLGRFSTAGAA